MLVRCSRRRRWDVHLSVWFRVAEAIAGAATPGLKHASAVHTHGRSTHARPCTGPAPLSLAQYLDPTKQVLRELRVKGALMDHKEIRAAMGVKIVAPGLETAIAGTSLFVVGPEVRGGKGCRVQSDVVAGGFWGV
jgi:hypothetical protein